MSDRSGFATTTQGPRYWGERIGASLVRLRLARQPRTEVAAVDEGIVHVRGTVRAMEPTIPAPLSGRAAVFGRLLASFERRRPGPPSRGLARDIVETLVQADVTFGGGFVVEDASGRARVELRAEDPYELFVLVRRMGPWNRGERLEHLRDFSRRHPRAPLALDDERMIYAEWAIEEGQTISVIGAVEGHEGAPDDREYRGMRRVPILGVRGDRPLLLVE